MKLKRICDYIGVVILIFALFCNINVDAAESAKKCKLSVVTNEQKTKIKINFGNNVYKTGYFYEMNMGGEVAFCLDVGKKARNGNVYTVASEPIDKTTHRFLYAAYALYLNPTSKMAGDPNFRMYIQAAIWYFMETRKTFNQPLYDAMSSALLTSKCSSKESQIRQKNGEFSCSCWLSYDYMNIPSGCDESQVNIKNSLGKLTPLSVEDYLDDYWSPTEINYYLGNLYSGISSPSNSALSEVLLKLSGPNGNNYMSIDVSDLELYVWTISNGDGNYQKIISTIAPDCPEVTSCTDDVNDLLGDYAPGNRAGNATYLSKLNGLKIKYPNELNDNDVENPRCYTDCDDELSDFLGNYSDISTRTTANVNYYNGLKRLQRKYGLNINDIANPTCPPGTVVKICDPRYEPRTCSFNVDEGGFYISDQGEASDGNSCYFSQGIAYTTDDRTEVSSIASDLSNDYCTLKCWEEFEGKFPAAIRDIKAGTKFFWGKNVADGYLGSLKAVRYCSTTFIDYGKFGRDFDINEGEVSSAYNSYVAQKTYNESSANYTGSTCHTSETTGCATEKTEYSCPNSHFHLENGRCLTYDDANTGLYTCISSSASHPCITNDVSPTVTKSCATCPSGYSVKDGKCHKDGKMYGKTAVTGATNNADVCVPNDKTDKTAYFNDHYNLSTELSNRKTAVQKEITDRKDLIADINACQSQNVVNSTSMYNFTSSVTLNYEDPRGIDRNITNPITLTATENKNVTDGGQHVGAFNKNCSSTPLINQYEGCNTATGVLTVQKYNEYHWNFTGEWKYNYDKGNYFWYTVLENFEMINYKTYEDYDVGAVVPYENGYGIPTAFSTITGFYDISIDVKGFGHNGHFNSLVQEKTSTDIYNYACKYHVENKIYGNECVWDCDFVNQTCTLKVGSPEYCEREVKGLDIVYRLIEMPNNVNLETRRKTVFPSIDGDGREPGTNWEKFINEHTTGFTNVTSNNVVYDNNSAINTYGPIYEIELTPSAISQIREDTLSYRNTDKDPYTSYTDANNHEKVICKGDHTERTCASNYITELIQSNIITGGYYLKCNSCRNNTNERLDWIDSQKERFY